jgi:hypothetical protein
LPQKTLAPTFGPTLHRWLQKAAAEMATKIFDLEIEALPERIDGLEGYGTVLVLARYRNVPVGKVSMAVAEGQVNGRELREAILGGLIVPLSQRAELNRWGLDQASQAGLCATATVAVCTRERPEDLKKCIESLMILPDDGQEYLVIDNDPATDGTLKVVALFPRVRYASVLTHL